MKILKILLTIVVSLILFLVALFLYFDSDFFESRRLRGQIEKDLGISLSNVPKLIQREDYGWAEEGGDKAFLLLHRKDCLIVEKEMTREENSRGKSDYFKMVKRNGLSPKSVKTWRYMNSQGDFTNYALDLSSCILYRRYHYEYNV